MEDKTFSLLEKMYSELVTFKEDAKEGFDDIEKTAIKIEQEHGKKLDVLFDGCKQNSEQLARIGAFSICLQFLSKGQSGLRLCPG
jgi:hypothetical protein